VKKGKINRRLTRSAVVRSALAIGLLDSKAATKGASDGSVAAADSADVAGRGTDAVEVLWHFDVDGELLCFLLGQAEGAWDVVGNLEGREGGDCVAGLVHVALEGTSAVGVDLMDGDFHDGALGDLGHAAGGELVLGLLADVDVAVDLGAAAGVDNVLSDLAVTDDGGILLAGGDIGAVASNVGIDWK
jgi:hypothetical protein